MPISVLQDLKTPHIRITSLMLLWEMCYLEIIRYSIQSTTSIFRIHDYFLAKALDQARPGGMVAVITTKGTLRIRATGLYESIWLRGQNLWEQSDRILHFKDNAGTEVTADILFLQKRERKIDIEPDWVHPCVTGDGIAVNSYFESTRR